VTIAGAGSEVAVRIDAVNPADMTRSSLRGFAEGQGVISIEPEHYSKRNDVGARRWIRIEDYGHTLSGMRADAPVDVAGLAPGKDSPSLEYRMYVLTPGAVTANLILSPTLNFAAGSSTHTLAAAGSHTLKVWMVDPGVVVQKIVVNTPSASNASTYLGPPESFRR
jgi:hypothetical protein